MNTTFDYLWQLLYNHGATTTKKADCARLWDTYTPEQQHQLCRTIHNKLQQHKFVQYDPIRAMKENVHQQHQQQLSYADYYARYGTTIPQDGWKMINPTGQRVIYVKELTFRV